jgi:hypothetical protein
MNIFQKIKDTKKKVMDYQDKRQQEKAVRTAQELKELKERRIRAEGREKIYIAQDREKQKLKEANLKLRKRTPLYRVADALREKLKENQKKKKKSTFGTLPGQNFKW